MSSSSSSGYILPVSSFRQLPVSSTNGILTKSSKSLSLNILRGWFGSHLEVGFPTYLFLTTLPLLIALKSQRDYENEQRELLEEAKKKGRQVTMLGPNGEHLAPGEHNSGLVSAGVSYRKKQVSVLLITWLDIISNSSVALALSNALNYAAASSSSSSSNFLQSWAFQNNYAVNLKGYFFKNVLEKIFIPRWVSTYFFAPDPTPNTELDHFLASGQHLNFGAVFEDYLKRNAIDSIARACSVSVGLALLLIPSVRKVLRPPEAVLSEQPHLAAMMMMQQKQQNQKNDRPRTQEDIVRQQLEFVEQMTMPTVDGTIGSIKQVWFDEFKILLVSATVSGLLRKFVTNDGGVEFWVGSYLTMVMEKVMMVLIGLKALK